MKVKAVSDSKRQDKLTCKAEKIEDKSKKFKRIATLRVNNALEKIRIIGNLADRNIYDFTPKQVEKIMSVLQMELKYVEEKFKEKKKEKVVFDFDDNENENTDTKICSKCRLEKPLSEFHKDPAKKGGVHSSCKDCCSKRYM